MDYINDWQEDGSDGFWAIGYEGFNPWKEAFNNILHRTQPVVEGVDIAGGDIILAPTLNQRYQLSANLIPENAMRSTGRERESSSGVKWNIGNYLSTATEDGIAKVTGDGLLTTKGLGNTRVYVTTNSLGFYTYRNVTVKNDEIGQNINITVGNIYGTKLYGATPSYKSNPTGLKGTGTFKAGSVPGDFTFTVKVIAENGTVKEYPVVIHVVFPSGNGWRLSEDTLYISDRDRSKSILRFDGSPRYPYRKYVKHVSLDDSLSVISPLMLYGLYNITELHLPLNLKSIGDNAFTGCDNLISITSESQTPPKANSCSFLNSQGRHTGNKTVLRVHGESHSAYTNAGYRRGFTTVKTIENDDATLKSLAVRHLNLTPAFSRDIFEYSIIVTDDPYSVIIDAESADPDAQVSGQGIFKSVVFEDTVFKVVVVAANHVDKKEYRINIRRIGSDASLKSIQSNVQLYPDFNKDTLDYVCIVPDSVEYFRLSVEPANKYTKLLYNPSYKIDYGKTTFNIRSVSEDGSHSLTYKVTAIKTFHNYQSEERTTGTVDVPATDVQAFIRDKVLHVDSRASEQIAVYSVTGKLLRSFEKPAGRSTLALAGSFPEGILIVRGGSGWVQKVRN